MSLLTNLLAHWKLDETAGARADAHGSADLTDNNTVGYATGKLGNAADFEDDNDEYLSRQVEDSAALKLGTDSAFTVAAWINIESDPVSGTGGIVSFGSLSEGWSLTKRTSGNAIRLYWTGQTSSTTHQIAAPATGVWALVMAWHDPVADKLYLQVNDGTPAEKAWSDGSDDDPTSDFQIGAYATGHNFGFDGLIDEVSLWDRVLTDDERAGLYNSGAGLDYDNFDSGGADQEVTGDSAVIDLQTAAGEVSASTTLDVEPAILALTAAAGEVFPVVTVSGASGVVGMAADEGSAHAVVTVAGGSATLVFVADDGGIGPGIEISPGAGLTLDQHQRIRENGGLNRTARYMQLVFRNARGRAAVRTIDLAARHGPRSGGSHA
jgi:hypothetical protein